VSLALAFLFINVFQLCLCRFAPNQVIKGWTEAMQLMVEGDMWEMYIPSGEFQDLQKHTIDVNYYSANFF